MICHPGLIGGRLLDAGYKRRHRDSSGFYHKQECLIVKCPVCDKDFTAGSLQARLWRKHGKNYTGSTTVSPVEPVPHYCSLNSANWSEGSQQGVDCSVDGCFYKTQLATNLYQHFSISTTHIPYLRMTTPPPLLLIVWNIGITTFTQSRSYGLKIVSHQYLLEPTMWTKQGRLLQRYNSVRSQLVRTTWSRWRTSVLGTPNLFYRFWCTGTLFESCQGSEAPSAYLLLNYKRGSWSSCWWKKICCSRTFCVAVWFWNLGVV